nr:hypothetical protein BAR15_160091 [Bartonella sp. AR 15-3]
MDIQATKLFLISENNNLKVQRSSHVHLIYSIIYFLIDYMTS